MKSVCPPQRVGYWCREAPSDRSTWKRVWQQWERFGLWRPLPGPARTMWAQEVTDVIEEATVRSLQQSKGKLVQALGTCQTAVQPTVCMALKFRLHRLSVVCSPLTTEIPVAWVSSTYWSRRWETPTSWAMKLISSFVANWINKIVNISLLLIHICTMKTTTQWAGHLIFFDMPCWPKKYTCIKYMLIPLLFIW